MSAMLAAASMFIALFGVLWLAMSHLSQADADGLLAMEKHCLDVAEHDFPYGGGKLNIPLVSPDRAESFLLDLNRARIKLSKITLQNRARQAIILARLDIDGPPHTNPDGTFFPCPHLHLYRQGYGDKIAFPLPAGAFTNLADPFQTCQEFMQYVNITQVPRFKPRLV